MDWIYKAVVRPKITYGCVIWSHSIKQKEIDKLRRLQRLAMLAITQPLRSTPTLGLEVMLGWVPLDLHAVEIGLNTYYRIKHDSPPTWDYIGKQAKVCGHLGRWKKLGETKRLESLPKQKCSHQRMWTKSHMTREISFETNIHIYTDASKEGIHVGYGWLATDNDYIIAEDVHSAIDTDVYLAEVMAIKEALSWVKANYTPERGVTIWSDSKSAVDTLTGHVAKNYIVLETMTILKEVDKQIPIDIKWIKGHNNNTGNEVADYLARVGAQKAKEIAYAFPYQPITSKEVKKFVHEIIIESWQQRWNNQKTCRISKLFCPKVNDNTHVVKMRIKDIQALSHIVTGHGLFKSHLQHWNDIHNFQCELCQEGAEDTWHLWEYCPTLERERQEVKGLPRERALLKFFGTKRVKELIARNESLLIPS